MTFCMEKGVITQGAQKGTQIYCELALGHLDDHECLFDGMRWHWAPHLPPPEARDTEETPEMVQGDGFVVKTKKKYPDTIKSNPCRCYFCNKPTDERLVYSATDTGIPLCQSCGDMHIWNPVKD